MALLTVRPTKTDEKVAREVAAHTDRRIERGAEIVTWAADEHLLVGVAALGWLISRRSEEPTLSSFRRPPSVVLGCRGDHSSSYERYDRPGEA